MAGKIKGITIEYAGDTTKLDRSLKDINKETSALDRELKKVDQDLKFNPTNIELWRQKQQLLTEKITQTSDKLQILKQKQKEMDSKGVDKNSKAYRELQREIITTQSKLKTFKGQLAAVGNVNLRALGEKFKAAGGKIKAAGQQLRAFSRAGAAVVGVLGVLAKKTAAWVDDISTMSKQYSISTDKLQIYSAAAELVDTDVETIVKSHIKLERSMKQAADGSEKYADTFKQLGVEVTNADGSLRDSEEVWQEVITSLGQMTNETERDALAMQLMGKSATDLNPLIEDGGETYKRVAETMKKYGLDFIDEDTLKRANEFNDQLDTIKLLGMVAFQQVGTELAAYLVPAMEKVVDWGGKLANWISQLDPEIVATVGAIAGVIAVVAPLLIIIGSVISAVGTIIGALSSLMGFISSIGAAIASAGGIVAVLSGPVGWVIAAIAAIIAIGVLLWKNWDKVKAVAIQVANAIKTAWTNLVNYLKTVFTAFKILITAAWNAIKSAAIKSATGMKNSVMAIFNALKSAVSTVFNAIKSAITKPIQAAVSLVRAAFNKIKSILSGKISLPHIKLPHFKINGSFSLNPPSVPSIGVDWYKNGAIFTKPTIAGLAEASPEGIVPLDILWKKLDAIAAAASGDDIANAIGTGLAIQSTGMTMPGTINVVVELDGVKVGQKIVSLYDYTKRAMG